MSQDGRLLCNSVPFYGEGEDAGDEAGYIVGMSTCYPTPGSVVIKDGELLSMVSNYSNDRMHTGVMGLFYILVAEPQLPSKSLLSPGSILWQGSWWVLALVAGVLVAAAASIRRRRDETDGYLVVSTD